MRKKILIRIPEELYNLLWKIHSETHKSLNQIIVEFIKEGLKK